MNLTELKALLQKNSEWLQAALNNPDTSTKRIFELSLHRSLVKDLIIEAQEKIINERRDLATRPFTKKEQVG